MTSMFQHQTEYHRMLTGLASNDTYNLGAVLMLECLRLHHEIAMFSRYWVTELSKAISLLWSMPLHNDCSLPAQRGMACTLLVASLILRASEFFHHFNEMAGCWTRLAGTFTDYDSCKRSPLGIPLGFPPPGQLHILPYRKLCNLLLEAWAMLFPHYLHSFNSLYVQSRQRGTQYSDMH